MFFVFDNEFAKETRLWDFDSLEMHLHKLSIHGFLAILTVMRVGMKRFLLYSDFSETQIWDGRPHPLYPQDESKPSSFDPAYHLLHVHSAAFPDDLGKRVQAMYLSRYGLTKGQFIPGFLENYLLPETELMDRLATEESAVNKQLSDYGQTLEDFGFNFSAARQAAGARSNGFWKRLNLPRKGFKALEQAIRIVSQGRATVIPTSKKRQFGAQFDHPSISADSFWPADVATQYQDVNPEIFGGYPWWDHYRVPPSDGYKE